MLVATSTMFAYSMTHQWIPVVADYFLNRTNLHGIDMGKKDRPKLPESLGIVVGLTYLATFIIFFIIFPYIFVKVNILQSSSLPDGLSFLKHGDDRKGFHYTLGNIAALTSIFAMLALGWIDDCYDLRWRYKLMFPFAASIPLLSVYYYSYHDRTTILLPYFISKYFNTDGLINIGLFYYLFMLMFVIFCTNAINIYAGINGLEVGQTICLSVTVILYNLIEVLTKSDCDEVHILSLQLLLPFLFCSCALYKFNRYPAQVFVGDSYCYFAGMTLAVVGILGHFSEEILLFAMPQVFNFIVSIPQLFKFVPCPRHRLPKFNPETSLREPSTFTFRYSELNLLGRIIMKIYSIIGFAMLTKNPPVQVQLEPTMTTSEFSALLDDQQLDHDQSKQQQLRERLIDQQNKSVVEDEFTSNNLTLINLWLCWFGPKDERTLCHQLLRLQCQISFLSLALLIFIKLHQD